MVVRMARGFARLEFPSTYNHVTRQSLEHPVMYVMVGVSRDVVDSDVSDRLV
jgi:hypothetical protein